MKSGIEQAANLTNPDGSEAGYRAWLYDVDGEDAPVRIDNIPAELSDEQMLWIDVDVATAGNLDTIWDALGIDELARVAPSVVDRPAVVRRDHFLQMSVLFPREVEGGFEPVVLQCLVARNWMVTLHSRELDLADKFNEPLVGETRLGGLDGPAFLSMVLEWQMSGYFQIIEKVQEEIDRLDEELLKPTPNKPALLERMLMMRRRVTALRKSLSSHRDVFSILSHPQSVAILGSDSALDYRQVTERLERALEAVGSARDMIAGSFDIFMTQTSHATNEIMKRLTLASLLLLPAVVVAGIMGMNFKIGIFDRPWMFAVTLGLMAVLALVTLLVAKRRLWI